MNNLRPGFAGHDAMREKAERMFRDEMKAPDHAGHPGATSREHEKYRRYAHGGVVKKHPLTKEQTDLHIPIRVKTPKLPIQSFAEASAMKRGGKVRHHAENNKGKEILKHVKNLEHLEKLEHKCKMKHGGKVHGKHSETYDYMVGEHPSHKMPHFNYEKEMKGEHCLRKAMKEGGHVEKYAQGGVGKIRHKEATMSGKPIKTRKKIGY